MSKVLYITANPKPVEASLGLQAGERLLEGYKEKYPNEEIEILDLYERDIPLVDQDVLKGWGKLQQGIAFTELNGEEQRKVARINELTEVFIQADKYIVVSPLWNLSIPPMLKAYIDTIVIAGKTFKYTEQGPEGLLKDKKAVLIQSSGSIFSQEPAKSIDHGIQYLKDIFRFIGIEDTKLVYVEGTGIPLPKEEIENKANRKIEEILKTF